MDCAGNRYDFSFCNCFDDSSIADGKYKGRRYYFIGNDTDSGLTLFYHSNSKSDEKNI